MAIMIGGEAGVVPETDGAPRTYTAALVVLATVFFMWGFATVLNDILIPHLKSAFQLDYAQVLLIQFVFFLAYFVMAIPSAKILERTGYKLAVVIGLFGMAVSAAGFIPAAMLESFGLFLVALFLLAASITLLQVAANPYVAVIGPAETASSRLNLVQAFNSAGTMLAPLFGSLLILGHTAPSARAAHPSAAARAAGVHTVELPYAIIALVLLALAVLVWRVRLPDLGKETRRSARAERARHSLWRHRNLVFGVPAIALYLICEVGIGSTLVNFMSMPSIGALTHAQAADYLTLYWGGGDGGAIRRLLVPALDASTAGARGGDGRSAGAGRARDPHHRSCRDVESARRRPVQFDHVSDHLHARHPRPGTAHRGGIGAAHHGHCRRRARGTAGRARRFDRPAPLLRAALGVLRLRAVLCAVGLSRYRRRARRAVERFLSGAAGGERPPVVSSSARRTRSVMAARAAAGSRRSTASSTRR
jgi:fucose permease